MTPHEKAKELVNEKYYQPITLHLNVNNNSQQMWDYAKLCATICCDEMIDSFSGWSEPRDITIDRELKYWQSVKKEIEKL
jgi:hypothetical protein